MLPIYGKESIASARFQTIRLKSRHHTFLTCTRQGSAKIIKVKRLSSTSVMERMDSCMYQKKVNDLVGSTDDSE